MKKYDEIALFGDEFDQKKKEVAEDYKMFRLLKKFIFIDEEPNTPYKYKPEYYDKKAHYINGVKVNRDIYKAVKKWLKKDI